MTVTLFGVIVVLVGLGLLLLGNTTSMLLFVIVTSLFGGAASLQLPSLGGSSIPPASLALVFLLLRVVTPGPLQMAHLKASLSSNLFLLIFSGYGALSAWLMPRLFAGAVDVTPLHPGAVRQLYENAPVHFSSQNITTSIYLLGTAAAGIGSFAGARRARDVSPLLRIAILVAVTHALFGFVSIAVAGSSLAGLIEFFRNGHYAQLDQSIGGLSRMTGVWPEASGFAAYGGAWMIFMTELWLADMRPRATGPAAGLLALALLISTSSTAYVTLIGYAAVIFVRAILVPGSLSGRKYLVLLLVVLWASIGLLALLLSRPDMVDGFSKIVRIMTVDKASSWSGKQRLFWAGQGLDAFLASYGLGIGAGSFRSSSLFTAILGSTGLIGILAFAAHCLRALRPWRTATWSFVGRDERETIATAAGWTCVLMLLPAMISSPTPDPGLVWAIFAGLSLGLRTPASVVAIPERRGLARSTSMAGVAA